MGGGWIMSRIFSGRRKGLVVLKLLAALVTTVVLSAAFMWAVLAVMGFLMRRAGAGAGRLSSVDPSYLCQIGRCSHGPGECLGPRRLASW